jgi:hypothetical protein
MRCYSVEQILLSGPTEKVDDIAKHLHRCADCRRVAARVEDLRAGLANLDREPVPEALAARALQRGEPATVRSRRGFVRLVAATALTVVLTIGFLVAPRLNRPAPAQDMQTALDRANTWHIKGWKMRGQNRVEWETWVSRNPRFYYERKGDEVVYDDGEERIRVYPPLPYAGADPGLVVRTSSHEEAYDYGINFVRWGNIGPGAKPYRETAETEVYLSHDGGMQGPFTITDNYLTIDKRTHLPISMETQEGNDESPARVTSSSQHAEYDIRIPMGNLKPSVPPGYRYVDALDDTRPNGASGSNVESANGLTVQAEPVALGDDGTIVLETRAWLGKEPLDANEHHGPISQLQNTLTYAAGLPVYTSIEGPSNDIVRDERGRAFVKVAPDPMRSDILAFVPVEPFGPGTPLPRSVDLTLRVAAHVRGRGYPPDLAHADMAFRDVVLPGQATRVDLTTLWDPRNIRFEDVPVEAYIDEARARHYLLLSLDAWGSSYRTTGHPRESPELIAQSLKWHEAALVASGPALIYALPVRFEMIQLHLRLHQWDEAERLAREVLEIANRYPDHWTYTRKLEDFQLPAMADQCAYFAKMARIELREIAGKRKRDAARRAAPRTVGSAGPKAAPTP